MTTTPTMTIAPRGDDSLPDDLAAFIAAVSAECPTLAGGSDEEWAAFEERFLEGDEAAYQAAVEDFAKEQQQ